MSGLSPVRAWAALPVGVGFRGAGAMLGAWCPGFLVATVWPGRLLLLAPRLQEWGQGRPRSSSGSAREQLGFTPANSGAGFAPSGQAFRLWLPRVHFGGVSGDPHLAPKLARGPRGWCLSGPREEGIPAQGEGGWFVAMRSGLDVSVSLSGQEPATG